MKIELTSDELELLLGLLLGKQTGISQEDRALLDKILHRAGRSTKKLEALDAQTPVKP